MTWVIDASVAAKWLAPEPDSTQADALALSLQLQHPVCDCFYLALARRAEVPRVTADQRFHARCHAGDATELGQRVRLLGAV